jgi:hypothetical protein
MTREDLACAAHCAADLRIADRLWIASLVIAACAVDDRVFARGLVQHLLTRPTLIPDEDN